MTTRQILEGLIEAAAQVVSDREGEYYNDPSIAALEEIVRLAQNHLQGPVTTADEYEASLDAYEQDMLSARAKALRDARAAISKVCERLPDNTEQDVVLGLSMAIDAISEVSYFD